MYQCPRAPTHPRSSHTTFLPCGFPQFLLKQFCSLAPPSIAQGTKRSPDLSQPEGWTLPLTQEQLSLLNPLTTCLSRDDVFDLDSSPERRSFAFVYASLFKDLWCSSAKTMNMAKDSGSSKKKLAAMSTLFDKLEFSVLCHATVALINVSSPPETIVLKSLLDKDLPLPYSYKNIMEGETEPIKQDWGADHVAQMVCDGWYTLRPANGDFQSTIDRNVAGCWNASTSNIRVSQRTGTHEANKAGLVFRRLMNNNNENATVLLVDTSVCPCEETQGSTYVWWNNYSVCLKISSRINKRGLSWAHPVHRDRPPETCLTNLQIRATLVAMLGNVDPVYTAFNPFFAQSYTQRVQTNTEPATVRCLNLQRHTTSPPFNPLPEFRLLLDELLPLGGVMLNINGIPVFFAMMLILDAHTKQTTFETICGQCWDSVALFNVLPETETFESEPLMIDELRHLHQLPTRDVHPGTILLSRQLAETLKAMNDDEYDPEPGLFEYCMLDEDVIIQFNRFFFRFERASQPKSSNM